MQAFESNQSAAPSINRPTNPWGKVSVGGQDKEMTAAEKLRRLAQEGNNKGWAQGKATKPPQPPVQQQPQQQPAQQQYFAEVGLPKSTNNLTSKSKKKTTGPLHNNRYKVKMCKNWIKNGSCPYFEKCQFAHGPYELEKWLNRRTRSKDSPEGDEDDDESNDEDDEEVKCRDEGEENFSEDCRIEQQQPAIQQAVIPQQQQDSAQPKLQEQQQSNPVLGQQDPMEPLQHIFYEENVIRDSPLSGISAPFYPSNMSSAFSSTLASRTSSPFTATLSSWGSELTREGSFSSFSPLAYDTVETDNISSRQRTVRAKSDLFIESTPSRNIPSNDLLPDLSTRLDELLIGSRYNTPEVLGRSLSSGGNSSSSFNAPAFQPLPADDVLRGINDGWQRQDAIQMQQQHLQQQQQQQQQGDMGRLHLPSSSSAFREHSGPVGKASFSAIDHDIGGYNPFQGVAYQQTEVQEPVYYNQHPHQYMRNFSPPQPQPRYSHPQQPMAYVVNPHQRQYYNPHYSDA